MQLTAILDTRAAVGEAEEVRLARGRDAATWSEWYNRYQPLLFRYAYARTGHRQEAEDIAAQAFVQALQAIDGYRYRGRPVLAWLYRITHNLVTDVLRSKRRTHHSPDDLPEAALAGPALEEGLPTIELRLELGRLKPEQREVVVLRFVLGLPTREVAALLDKSEAAVYSLQVRGVNNLRRRIALPAGIGDRRTGQ